ncbi:hypothetical protein B0H19DRAFT_1271754 [Mycena capillaripes]|nr:hypothetical protein B0H19DRAFT_1271754 [Mycena capillaripes]
MSLLEKYNLRYSSSFDDVDGSPESSGGILDTLKHLPLDADASLGVADDDVRTDDFHEWGGLEYRRLGSPLPTPYWIDAEPITFERHTPKQPALAPHFPAAHVPPPVFLLGLGSDDEEDCDKEIAGMGAPKPILFPNAVYHLPSPASSLSAVSLPLSSEAPSPASTRDFESVDGGSSGSFSEWEGDAVDDQVYSEGYASDDAEDTDEEADSENDDVYNGEIQFQDEPYVHDDEVEQDASIDAHPQPRPTIPLPRRQLEVAPALFSAPAYPRVPIAGPSTNPLSIESGDDEEDAYGESEEEDEDDDYTAPAPASKRRRGDSGTALAVAAPKPKRTNANAKSKGKAKAHAAPKRKRAQTQQAAVEWNSEGAPPTHTSKNRSQAKQFYTTGGKGFICIFPVASGKCTRTVESESGISRHVLQDHLQTEGQTCSACGHKFRNKRRDLLRKHLNNSCKASLEKKHAALAQLEATGRPKKAKKAEA